MKKHSIQQLVLLFVTGAMLFGLSLSACAQTRPRSDLLAQADRKIVPRPRNMLSVDLWFDKQCGATYKQGEKIIVNFRTNADGYITIYDIDTRGQVTVIFPNRQHPENFVRANTTYSFPDRNYSYDLMVEGPEGIEYVDAVFAQDSYYQWEYNRGEPRWLYDWGLKGRQERDIRGLSSANYKSSTEYRNRPEEFSETGKQSIMENYAQSRQLRESIRSKIVARPREEPYQDYATATCYFYVTAPYYAPRPPRPTPIPSASWDTYLYEQQLELQRIPGYDISRSGDQLIICIPNTLNGRTYLFDFDSYELRYQARQDLDLVADILRRYSDTYITVAGHTDSIGDAGYNQRLSEYRAQSVANYLISRGIHPQRISYVGYGETMPIASNSTELGRQRNRRVELYLTPGPYYGR